MVVGDARHGCRQWKLLPVVTGGLRLLPLVVAGCPLVDDMLPVG